MSLELSIVNPTTGEVRRIPDWFEINSLDRDNFIFHLEQTPAMEAFLAECLAEVQRQAEHCKLKGDELEYQEMYRLKMNPIPRRTKKGMSDYDVSDEMCKAIARIHPMVLQYRQHYIDLCAIISKFKGYQEAFKTKKAFLASLAGITRTEMQQFQGYNNYDR